MDEQYMRRTGPMLFLNVLLSVTAGIVALLVVVTPSVRSQFPVLNTSLLVVSAMAIFGSFIVFFDKNERRSRFFIRLSTLCTFLMLACLSSIVLLR